MGETSTSNLINDILDGTAAILARWILA